MRLMDREFGPVLRGTARATTLASKGCRTSVDQVLRTP